MAIPHNPSFPNPNYIIQSWWFIVLILLILITYLFSIKPMEQAAEKSLKELQILEQEKNNLSAQKEDLLLQLENQSDPAWIEIVLKRNLGLVPKNQTKVYFYNKK